MKQLVTKAIILARTDYGEADRIITLLTPEVGKLRLMARGVRKMKSKLAGGIELFSVSDITYMHGRGDLGTLISARLSKHYGNIVKDIERVQMGYELIKVLNKATEDNPEPDYFHLLEQAFTALDDADISLNLIKVWFRIRLLTLAGHSPDLYQDTNGNKLTPDTHYGFSFDDMAFVAQPSGKIKADHIKFLRLAFDQNPPRVLSQVQGVDALLKPLLPIVETLHNASTNR